MCEKYKSKQAQRKAQILEEAKKAISNIPVSYSIENATKELPKLMTKMLDDVFESNCNCAMCKMRAYIAAGYLELHEMLLNEVPQSCEEEVSRLLYILWQYTLTNAEYLHDVTRVDSIEDLLEHLNTRTNTPKLASFKVPPQVLEDGAESFMEAVRAVMKAQAGPNRGN